MPIPDYQTFMRPVLAFLHDGGTAHVRDIRAGVIRLFAFADDELTELLPSGRVRVVDSRIGWAMTYLVQARLLTRPRRAYAEITDRGRMALVAHPERIDNTVLESYPEFRAFREKSTSTGAGDAVIPASTLGDAPPDSTLPAVLAGQASRAEATPTDLVEQAVQTNRAAVVGEVLRAALTLSPTGFEALVIRLLESMGYGRAGSVERTSATGDAGVDGIISQDPLGLDRIYVQAKRYAEERAIDRPRIHEFAGALLGRQGDRGVFITTSRFTKGAQDEAQRINARIELIDGERLAQLLVQYGVGVQDEQAVTLYRLDEDFFESL